LFSQANLSLTADQLSDLHTEYPEPWMAEALYSLNLPSQTIQELIIAKPWFPRYSGLESWRNEGVLKDKFLNDVIYPLLASLPTPELLINTTDEIDGLIDEGKLSVVSTGQIQNLVSSSAEVVVNTDIVPHVEDLFSELESAELAHIFWITDDARSQHHNNLLSAMNYPAPRHDSDIINPSASVRTITVAVVGYADDIETPYGRLVDNIIQNSEAYELLQAEVDADQTLYPTLELLIERGIVTDEEIIKAFNC